MKRMILTLVLVLTSFASIFALDQKKIAVMPLDCDDPSLQSIAKGMLGPLKTSVNEQKIVILITRSDVDKILDEMHDQQTEIFEAVKNQTLIKNVDYLVGGSLTFDSASQEYTLSLQLYDLSATCLSNVFESEKKSSQSLNNLVQKTVNKLFNVPKPKGSLNIKQDEKSKTVMVSWERASNDKNFEYKVVYSESMEDLTPYFAEEDAESGSDWSSKRKATFDVPDEKKTYYYTVLVRNPLGVQAMYEVVSSSRKAETEKSQTSTPQSSSATSKSSDSTVSKQSKDETKTTNSDTEKSQTSTPQSSSATSKSSDSTISKQSKDETKTTNSDTAKKYDNWDIGPGGGRVFHAFDSTGLKTYEYVIFNDKKTQNEAIKACSNYRGGGFSNWRLVKNSDEIDTILSIHLPITDANPYGGYIKDENFKKGACYWSADPGVACKIKEPSLIEQIYGSYGKWEYSKENVNPQKKYGYIAVREIQ
ncbi:MAG: hypothetical protein IKP60_01080 [Treponema sp.]|nr:hypothetical protein [Treponema sp.]